MALWGVDVPVQAWRHTVGPSARWLGVFSYLFLLIMALLLLRAGYRSARATGRLRTAALAGAIAAAPPATVLIVLTNLQTLAGRGSRADIDIVGYLIAFALFAGAGALIGAVFTLPAALVARGRFRKEHAEELAALAAQRAAKREREAEAEAQRRARRRPVPWTSVVPPLIAVVSVVFVPLLAAPLAYNALSRWMGLALAAAALAVGGALLAASNRTDWLGYVVDWLGSVCLCIGAIMCVGELTGYFVLLLAGPAELVYIWRLGDRMVRAGSPPPAERPERPPVAFRHDGIAIVIYPSRRKLALHAAFAGGLSLVAGTLTFLLRGAGPVPVICLGAFALGGLIGFIPDFARLLVRWPALIVNHEGITDLVSAGIFGFGLIPWHEIAGAFNAGTLRGGWWTELAIVPVSYRRLLSRQPLLKRPFLRAGSAFGGDLIFVGSLFLSQSPSAVANLINDYVKSHAPADYAEPDEDDPEESDEEVDADANCSDHADQGNPEQDN
jgi:hypothetical protein